ncbi:MAG: LPS export ABC transporter periplasmic protein LptC [Cyanobium sp. NAT70]|nr:LPS export ABC transporter periplasmic protein LptC [Cyanobium sp. NAT70]|tara:strand:+ start:215 stop:1417 length:1203 start_codon:yes stop_codon:yes gene_type:complete
MHVVEDLLCSFSSLWPRLRGVVTTGSIAAVLMACHQSSPPVSESPPPFVFRSLDLNQRQANGDRDWDLKSPEARYDLSSRTVRARRPSGVLYRENEPAYAISAELATVLNDGELIVLEGNIRLQQLNQRKVLMRGDRLVWTPSKSQMVIDQRPQADDAQSQLFAHHLTFYQQRNQLIFQGPTSLKRWKDRPMKDQKPQTDIQSGDGTWNLEDGSLNAQGPIQADHFDGKKLTASMLKGNTREGYIDLVKPVKLTMPDEKGNINAGTTRWFYNLQKLSSDAVFNAEFDKGNASGNGFIIDQRANTVIAPDNCRLRQPGEQLKAQRCSWNWQTDVVIADGDVELRRDDLNQITRAERLEGTIGEDGLLRFGAPGQRVKSSIKLKDSPVKGSQRDKTPAPVRF